MPLESDIHGKSIQGFATSKALAVTAGEPAVFTSIDVAFVVPLDCTYTLNAGASMSLQAGSVRVLKTVGSASTYIFDTTMVLEVM